MNMKLDILLDCRDIVVFKLTAREIPLFPPLTKGERGI
jgi:hypothetical protein